MIEIFICYLVVVSCILKTVNDGKISNEPIKCHDNEYQSFKWVSLKELDNYKILPKSNKDLILENINLFHIIERT